MIVASQYPVFEGPKIISGIRKRDIIAPTPNIRHKLSGDLLVKCGHEKQWWPRKVVLRGGHLVVSSRRPDDHLPTLGLPLRQLSLQAGPLPNSLALTKNTTVVLTVQASTEQHFDLWVKAIAIELIRQTPLFAVKYLDILNLTEMSKRAEDKKIEAAKAERSEPIEEKTVVETILKKCQNAENYVPVKEKLVLFESLCRMGRKVKSSEDVSCRLIDVDTKRARSMHDLSNFGNHIAVREICKYFENKSDAEGNGQFSRRNNRLVSSDSQLHNVKCLPKLSTR